jgi:hypothetical protein
LSRFIRVQENVLCRLFSDVSSFVVITSERIIVSQEVYVWSCHQDANVTISISVKRLEKK